VAGGGCELASGPLRARQNPDQERATNMISNGSRVRFRESAGPYKANAGVVYVVDGEPFPGPVDAPRPWAWLVLAEDVSKPFSRQRRRSGWLDELEQVV
jgi:hypothetical protein